MLKRFMPKLPSCCVGGEGEPYGPDRGRIEWKMKKFFVAFSLFISVYCIHAQTAALPIYACISPGTQALTSGLKSSNFQMGVIPGCVVTVYLTGTTNVATTSPQTPYTASGIGTFPPIYASTSQAYDVKFSGGLGSQTCTTPPNCYTIPFTITDVSAGGGGGGGGIPYPGGTGVPEVTGGLRGARPTTRAIKSP